MTEAKPRTLRSVSTRLSSSRPRFMQKEKSSSSDTYRTTLMSLDDHLPQPAEDQKIIEQYKFLYVLINSHMSFYQINPMEDSTREDILELLLKHVPQIDNKSKQFLAGLLFDPDWRTLGLKILIARSIFTAIDFNGDPQTTLLPPEMVSFMNDFKSILRSEHLVHVDELALCEWRRITSFLLAGPNNKPQELVGSQERVNRLAGSIDGVLAVFAKEAIETESEGKSTRLDSLKAIVKKGMEFGQFIFSQPCGWQIDWTPQKEIREGSYHLDQSTSRHDELGERGREKHYRDHARNTKQAQRLHRTNSRNHRPAAHVEASYPPSTYQLVANGQNRARQRPESRARSENRETRHLEDKSRHEKYGVRSKYGRYFPGWLQPSKGSELEGSHIPGRFMKETEPPRSMPKSSSTAGSEEALTADDTLPQTVGSDGNNTSNVLKPLPPRPSMKTIKSKIDTETGGTVTTDQEFTWVSIETEIRDHPSPHIVCFPALFKTSDEYGFKLDNPVRVADAVVAK